MALRFQHLLGPIRDLVENWNVSIASDLEDYLETLEELHISFERVPTIPASSDRDQKALNFAEAALLIQGSTCIYSKKVEFLWRLVHETLEFVTGTKHRTTKALKSNHAAQGFAASCTRVDVEFLTLKGIIKPTPNINLVEHTIYDWSSTQTTPGIGLTPRGKWAANIKNRGTPWAHFATTERGGPRGGLLGNADVLTLDSMPAVLMAASAGRRSSESAARVLKCEIGRRGMLFLERRQVHCSVLNLGLMDNSEENALSCDSNDVFGNVELGCDDGGVDGWSSACNGASPPNIRGGVGLPPCH